MAVTQTGAMYKSLTFDGKTSRSYGVYITGEAVYNAPERAVEMISIPGRNGSFALDQGRFENIEVSYPAGIFAENETDFAQAVSDFRNYLCSRKGYCRLTDEYNPSEYRMAVYKSGLEVDPAQLRAGEFTITFECKPQRWLTSGETKSSIASGGTITNPTLFDANPLLEVYGYGDITVGGEEITVNTSPMGNVIALNSQTVSSYTTQVTIPDVFVSGDVFTVSGAYFTQAAEWTDTSWYTFRTINNYNLISNLLGISSQGGASNTWNIAIRLADLSFTYGTSSSITASGSARFNYHLTDDSWLNRTQTFSMTIAYDGADTLTYTGNQVDEPTGYVTSKSYEIKTGTVSGYSNKVLNDPLYIDLDVGEAYKIVSSEIVAYNNAVLLPANLPKLSPGSNTITYDNTITKIDVVPRWWKV